MGNAKSLQGAGLYATGVVAWFGLESVAVLRWTTQFFSREACTSMEDGDGLRAGLYVRRIDEALKIRRITPLELDDVDLQNGIVYPSLAV